MKKNNLLILLVLLLLFIIYCIINNDKKIDNDYSIILNNSDSFQLQFELSKFLNTISQKTFKSNNKNLDFELVNLDSSISNYFNPENFPCPLPKKTRDKINKTINWVPKEVKTNLQIDTIINQALRYEGSAPQLLNTIQISPKNGDLYSIRIPPNDYNILDYINPSNNFLYSLDCSGYLNVALQFKKNQLGSFQGTSAASANGGISILFSKIVPPVGEAIRKTLPINKRMKDFTAFSLLFSFRDQLWRTSSNILDTIYIPNDLIIIQICSNGQSSYNGQFNAEANNSLVVPINLSTGAQLTRSCSFNKCETFLTNVNGYFWRRDLPQPIFLKEIDSLLNSFTKNCAIISGPKNINNTIEFTLDMPLDLKGNWSVSTISNAEVSNPELGDNGRLKFVISNLSSTQLNGQITITKTHNGLTYTKMISLQ